MSSVRTIPVRNLLFHWKGNLAVLLGVVVAAAVLTGALFVGDSLRGSLRDRGERQLLGVTSSWVGPRLVGEEVTGRLTTDVVPALYLQGAAWTDGGPTLPRVSVIGLNRTGAARFALPQGRWDANQPTVSTDRTGPTAMVTANVAERLGITEGDAIVLSVQRGSAIPRSSLLGKRNSDDVTTTLRVRVSRVLPREHMAGDFNLTPSPTPPMNVFVALGTLQERIGQKDKVNALFGYTAATATLNDMMTHALEPASVGIRVVVPPTRKAFVSVEAEQLLLDPPTVGAVQRAAESLKLRSEPTSVYLANWIAVGEKRIPYSLVAGVNPTATDPLGPFLPPGRAEMKDDEIVLVDWPESPLKDVPAGEKVRLDYFQPETEAGVVETSATFTLAGRIPLAGVAADPDLTPPFPGVTDKLRIGDWDPPFPFDNSRIKPGDTNERFWNKHRTTPKAYITKAAADKLFGSRFGDTTSIRVAPAPGESPEQTAARLKDAIHKQMNPESLGIVFEATRERVLAASGGSNDFAGLFLGFSLFLIVSALLLVGLLFRLSVERRAKEIGLFLAAGYSPGRVRQLLLAEGLLVAVIGTVIGLAVAVGYSQLLLAALGALWPDASVASFLKPHYSILSFVIGAVLTLLTAGGTILLSLRGMVTVPIPALLRGSSTDSTPNASAPPRRWVILPAVCTLVGVGVLFFGSTQTNPDAKAGSFFGGGGLLLTAGLMIARNWLRSDRFSLPNSRGATAALALGPRNAGRFPGRSLLTVALVAGASFLLVAVESFRRNPETDFADKTGGSGGFNLIAESDVPLFQTFDKEPGRGELLDNLQAVFQKDGTGKVSERVEEASKELATIRRLIPLRLSGGDDASCLNLYQANRPRVVGVPDILVRRGGFRFASSLAKSPEDRVNPWRLFNVPDEKLIVPVIVEQNTAMWMLKVGVGDIVMLPTESGSPRKGRIVATLQDSVFQSQLLIPDRFYRELFPHDDGHRLFLLETPVEKQREIATLVSTGYRANGMAVTPTRDRVAGYQAVVGTYLTTFQLLGGLGLGLGILGVAVVILRGVWERAGELALLRAFGYTTGDVRLLVLGEYLSLLLIGLGLGLLAAALSVAPHAATGGVVPYAGIAVLVGGVLTAGVLVVTLATAGAARVPLVPALRAE